MIRAAIGCIFAKALIYPRRRRAVRAPARPERPSRPARAAAVRRRASCGYRVSGGALAGPAPALAFTLAFVGATLRAGVHRVPDAGDPQLLAGVHRVLPVALQRGRHRHGSAVPARQHSDLVAAVLLGGRDLLEAEPCAARLRRSCSGRGGAANSSAASSSASCSRWRRPPCSALTAINDRRIQLPGRRSQDVLRPFPFDASARRRLGRTAARDEHERLRRRERARDFTNRFDMNVEYFLIGRHFGFVPYFFPGRGRARRCGSLSRERSRPWRVVHRARSWRRRLVALLVFAPYTWSGGGGPPGNRYFMSVYAAMLFLMPPLDVDRRRRCWRGWAGRCSRPRCWSTRSSPQDSPYQTTERGFVRRLPVELTMANDLPIMLEGVARAHLVHRRADVFPGQARVQPGSDRRRGDIKACGSRATAARDILVRCEWPIDHLRHHRAVANADDVHRVDGWR